MGASTPQRARVSGRGRHRSKAVPMAEINVTPFVDVMLVLLIIFMVAAPLLTVGVPINLPETAATPLAQEDEEPLSIALAADGTVTLQSDTVVRSELVTRLTAVAGERRGSKVFLRADGSVPYGEIMEVMGALNAAGFRNIGLVTEGGGPTLTDGTE